MGLRSNHKKTKRGKQIKQAEIRAFRRRKPQKYLCEYHSLRFRILHQQYALLKSEHPAIPLIRRTFWQRVPPRTYDSSLGQDFLRQYLVTIERALEEILSQQSVTYWHHVYRRLAPGAIGEDNSPATIANTRAILDAAIQKYGRFELCDKIAFSGDITTDDVFAGEPQGFERALIANYIRNSPSLVLTNFTVKELSEFYRAERLAYEVWRTAAALRITGKGAPLAVTELPPYFFDDRGDELDKLVSIYDARLGVSRSQEYLNTQTGTVFENSSAKSGTALCYTLNLSHTPSLFAPAWLEHLGHPTHVPFPLSFTPLTVNLSNYLEAHRPLEEEFDKAHGFSLEECVLVLSAISWLPLTISKELDPYRILRPEQRGYDGAYSLARIEHWIHATLPVLAKGFNCRRDVAAYRVSEVLHWLTLTKEQQDNIDLVYPGPHSIFLPVVTSQSSAPEYFIDYVWLLRRLSDLFYGISVSDNNFKGDALEQLVRGDSNGPLHHGQLHALDGTSRQVDSSFGNNERLFIVECRAWSRSIGYEKGQVEAIQQRSAKIKKTLTDIDDKAKWLASHPVGRNYDIRRFAEIIPVGVAPFPEFIPSLFEWYWLRADVPRVMTPQELVRELQTTDSSTTYYHGYEIARS